MTDDTWHESEPQPEPAFCEIWDGKLLHVLFCCCFGPGQDEKPQYIQLRSKSVWSFRLRKYKSTKYRFGCRCGLRPVLCVSKYELNVEPRERRFVDWVVIQFSRRINWINLLHGASVYSSWKFTHRFAQSKADSLFIWQTFVLASAIYSQNEHKKEEYIENCRLHLFNCVVVQNVFRLWSNPFEWERISKFIVHVHLVPKSQMNNRIFDFISSVNVCLCSRVPNAIVVRNPLTDFDIVSSLLIHASVYYSECKYQQLKNGSHLRVVFTVGWFKVKSDSLEIHIRKSFCCCGRQRLAHSFATSGFVMRNLHSIQFDNRLTVCGVLN